MELNIREPKNMDDLKELIKGNGNIPEKFYVAVESNIFDKDNKWIFMRRGPGCKDGRLKLEGIGGGVEETDNNFRSALHREIEEESGKEATINIKKFLYARTEEVFDLHEKVNKFWIILSYIGTLEKGELKVMEENKNLGYERYSIDKINTNELTDCAKSAYAKISKDWEKIKEILEENQR